MKKTIVILSVIILASCQKANMTEDESETSANTCQIVSHEAVPPAVQQAFATKYPDLTVEKWFNKDDKGFTAVFTRSENKTLAQFDNDGTFRTETVDPSTIAPTDPSCSNCPPPKSKCGKGPHKRRPFIPMMKKKHKGDCNKERKERECQVILSE
jgi:hypothetical protein